MAVVGIAKEIARGREAMQGVNGQRSYRRIFLVTCDSTYDDANVVKAAPGIPPMYTAYVPPVGFGGDGTDPGSCVVSIEAMQSEGSRFIWFVTVDYSTEYDQIEDPLKEPPEIHYGSESFSEALPGMPSPTFTSTTDADLSSDLLKFPVPTVNPALAAYVNGILNSAGHVYNPPPERQMSRPIITYSVNQSTFDAAFKLEWEGTINKATWNGLKPRQALLRSVDAQSHVFKSLKFNTPDVYYYRLSYVFTLKAETWDVQLLDYGPYYLKWPTVSGLAGHETPDRVPFTTADGTPRMGLLDHSDVNRPGRLLADGSVPQYNRYPAHREADFDKLSVNLKLPLTAQKKPLVRSSGPLATPYKARVTTGVTYG